MPEKKKSTGKAKKSSGSRKTFTEKKLSPTSSRSSIKKKTIKRPKTASKKTPSRSRSKATLSRKEYSKKIEKELTEIYENSDGSMPDMTKFKKRKGRGTFRALLTLFVALVFLGAVAWVGFFVLQSPSKFSEEDVILSVSGEEQVVAGDEVQYRIRYRNTQSISLNNATLQVRYPAGFVFDRASVEPSNNTKDKWDLGEIKSDEGGIIDIFGSFHGSLGESQSVRVFLNYFPENFSSEFQKVTSLNTKATDSPISFTIGIPKEVPQGSDVPFTVSVKKEDGFPDSIERIAVVVEGEEVFTKKSSTPESDSLDELQWTTKDFDEEFKVNIVGSFDSEEGAKEISFKTKVLGIAKGQGIDDAFVLAEESIDLKLVETTIVSTVIINGSVGDLSVEPGEKLNVSVVTKNAGEATLKNAKVRLVFDAPSIKKKSILHWAKVEDPADGTIRGEQLDDTTRRGEITWDKRQVKELASIAPGESVVIDVQLPVKTSDVTDLAAFETWTGKIFGDVQYDGEVDASQRLVDLGSKKEIISSNSIGLTIQSDLSLEVRADVKKEPNDQKMYTVTWLLNNSFHELKDLNISADFFGDVSFDEKTTLVPPAGKVTVDEQKNKLIWTIPTMPTELDVLAYQFKVKLHKVNAGQTQLSSKVRVEATDVVTGEKILKAIDGIILE